ncbi:hypothetical protein [Verrucomicrobium sp. BvORR106]|uniref:hypothetical protein n=1 Tax=Verrucomicrobium sp. BvORR106 TaxID=1403819 RepID=UPI002240F9CE|nr:hypothetical protein [Verrucomicrobium sp. BvORR106]
MDQTSTISRQSSVQSLPHLAPPDQSSGGLQQVDPPKPKGQVPPTDMQRTAPSSFKTQGLKVSDKVRGRVQQTVDARAAKQAKFDSPPPSGPERDKVLKEKSKDTQSRFQKFLKEFKSVFKNTGKAIKAGGDGAKYIGGSGHDVSKITGGIGAGAQIVETVSDIYLAKVKIDKAKSDLEIVKEFSPEKMKQEEANLRSTRSDLLKAKSKIEGHVDKAKSLVKSATKELKSLDRGLQLKDAEIGIIKGKLKGIHENIQLMRARGYGEDFLVEQGVELQGMLDDLQGQRDDLAAKREACSKKLDTRQTKLDGLQEKLTECNEVLKSVDDALAKNTTTGRMKGRVAEKDLNSFNDNVGLERAKMVKSLWDGQKAVLDIGTISSAGTQVVSEGFKLAGGVTGVVVGPLTVAVNSYEFYNDVTDNRAFLALKKKSTDALSRTDVIKQDDVELLAIAERLRLKQKKQSVDKGLSATKNFFGALGGVGTATAGAVAIAVTAGAVSATAAGVVIATPIGWALAGGAALAAIGYGIYKLARHINSKGIKEALQTTLKNLDGQDGTKKISDLGLEGKDAKAMTRVTDKMVKALKAQGITAKASDFTVADVQAYASSKLLARDSGVATASLYHRFKEELTDHFAQKGITDPTEQDMEDYINAKKDERPVSTAVGLMSTLGLSLNKAEALDMFRDSSSSDSIKFLTKKLKLA